MEQYVTEMLRCMRDVNVDNNTVGWYMSTYMNSWLDPDGPTVATQFQFQDSVPKSVCLVYDPVRTLSGSVHLKAYRLSDRFMAKYKEHSEKQAADKNQHGFTESDMKLKLNYTNKVLEEGITIDDIFEEVPIRIHNSALVMAMLYDWACEGTMGCKLHSDFDRLDLSSRHFLEKSVENMVDGMDALRQDQERAEFRKRSPYLWHARACCRMCVYVPHGACWRMLAHVGAWRLLCAWWLGLWRPDSILGFHCTILTLSAHAIPLYGLGNTRRRSVAHDGNTLWQHATVYRTLCHHAKCIECDR